MAAIIPDEVRSNIPMSNPIIPKSAALASAPWINRCPKDVIGTKAPPPTNRIILS